MVFFQDLSALLYVQLGDCTSEARGKAFLINNFLRNLCNL